MVCKKCTDILILFDVEAITAAYPSPSKDPDNPTEVLSDGIYNVIKQGAAIYGDGGELKFYAEASDSILWREAGISLDSGYYAQLYKFEPAKGKKLFSDPVLTVARVPAFVSSAQDPCQLKRRTRHDHLWKATVCMTGSMNYYLNFLIRDRDGNQGFYKWKMLVKIEEPVSLNSRTFSGK